MRIKCKHDFEIPTDQAACLRTLARNLTRLQIQNSATQAQIEAATGVDQTTISRAKNGILKRVTSKIMRLSLYAAMRSKVIRISPKVKDGILGFLNAGGTEDELLAFVRDATRLVVRQRPSD